MCRNPSLLSQLRLHLTVTDGIFLEEPGSGAVATIENKKGQNNNAEYITSAVGIPIEKVISGVKPTEKKNFIMELQKDQNVVAMVGDGINDAAALASSHVGIAMGVGVGAASEMSSIVLLGNRLS
ncbi:hypothetical protein ACFX15_007091 [Malus domestica]